ncbi:MAG: hypothetical protein DHS20C18_51300 [Saprospiraceae bacterium]|nr:MAG: hypothetical protein DHS20C18_51300 [Saprospiraceae bacterium]
MIKTVFYPITIALLQFLLSSEQLSGQGDHSWKLVKEEGKTKVYTRAKEDVKIKEVKITTTIKASMDRFLSVLDDVPDYINWVFRCKSAKRLLTISENEFYYYTSTKLPFPLSDRDIVIHTRQWKDPLTKTVYSESVADPDYIPEKENHVRIPFLKTSWEIRPESDGTLKISYLICTDPGGSLPAWLVNLAITQGPIKTMDGLARLVEDSKY